MTWTSVAYREKELLELVHLFVTLEYSIRFVRDFSYIAVRFILLFKLSVLSICDVFLVLLLEHFDLLLLRCYNKVISIFFVVLRVMKTWSPCALRSLWSFVGLLMLKLPRFLFFGSFSFSEFNLGYLVSILPLTIGSSRLLVLLWSEYLGRCTVGAVEILYSSLK